MGNYFKKWIGSRTVAFWICIVVALLSIFTAVYYMMTVPAIEGSGAEDLYMIYAVILPIVGAAAFIVLSLFNLANFGAAVMGICNLAGFILFAVPLYPYFSVGAMSYSGDFTQIPGFMTLIICAALFVVSCILSNIFAWIHLKKHPKKDKTVKSKTKTGKKKGSGSNGTRKQQPTTRPAAYQNTRK